MPCTQTNNGNGPLTAATRPLTVGMNTAVGDARPDLTGVARYAAVGRAASTQFQCSTVTENPLVDGRAFAVDAGVTDVGTAGVETDALGPAADVGRGLDGKFATTVIEVLLPRAAAAGRHDDQKECQRHRCCRRPASRSSAESRRITRSCRDAAPARRRRRSKAGTVSVAVARRRWQHPFDE